MELALFLILLVIVELVLTVILMARHRQYINQQRTFEKRVARLEKNLASLAEFVKDLGHVDDLSRFSKKDSVDDTLDVLASQISPEDIEKAQEILRNMSV